MLLLLWGKPLRLEVHGILSVLVMKRRGMHMTVVKMMEMWTVMARRHALLQLLLVVHKLHMFVMMLGTHLVVKMLVLLVMMDVHMWMVVVVWKLILTRLLLWRVLLLGPISLLKKNTLNLTKYIVQFSMRRITLLSPL